MCYCSPLDGSLNNDLNKTCLLFVGVTSTQPPRGGNRQDKQWELRDGGVRGTRAEALPAPRQADIRVVSLLHLQGEGHEVGCRNFTCRIRMLFFHVTHPREDSAEPRASLPRLPREEHTPIYRSGSSQQADLLADRKHF